MNENYGLLFSSPGFLSGVARTLDIEDTTTAYNTSRTPAEADYLGLRSDWRAVGEDFDAVIGRFEHGERE